ncbi:MAG: SPASM domain-containing protein [Clostridiales bacterium]|nr:SPASM domain-containing protein [Clostridiales bacterium]
MKKFKNSMYNIEISKDQEHTLIWNSFNGAIIKLENDIADKIKSNYITPDLKYFNELLESGIILSDDINEYAVVKQKEQEILKQEETRMSLIIAPTLKCNYKCVYCFEANKEKKKIMDYSDADKIISYIKNACLTSKIKTLTITWFGGEPMLCYDIIQYIGDKIKEFSKKHSIDFFSRMISNGSLLTLDKLKILIDKCNLKLIQITIDGMENTYTQKKGTTKEAYNKVINNVVELCDLVKIKIRINADKSNYKELMDVANFLLVEKNLKNKIDIYFAEIKNYNNDNGTDYYTIEEATKAKFDFYETLYNKGLIKKHKISPISFDPLFCGFKSKNNVAIGPNGDIYKCQHFINDVDKIVGYVDSNKQNAEILKEFYDPKNNKLCEKCSLYPVCRYNACPALKNMIKTTNNNCSVYNDLLNSIKFQCEQYIKNDNC